MKDRLVEIACIVDRSGSMQAITSDAIGGFNSFLDSQKREPGSARLTLVLFDHEYEVVHDSVDIQQVPPLNETTYQPRGTTALLDAIGRTIDDIGKRLSGTPKDRQPGLVIVAILTDGMENASRDYDYDRISKLIAHQHEKYAWEFIFLAANQDAIASAGKLSINANDAHSYQADSPGIHAAYSRMSDAVLHKRRRS